MAAGMFGGTSAFAGSRTTEARRWDDTLLGRYGGLKIEGVKVREMWEEFETMRLIARRVDGEIFFINRDETMEGVQIRWKPIEESWSNCVSCGQRHPAQFFDNMGRCGNTRTLRSKTIHKLFMERVRKHGKQFTLS